MTLDFKEIPQANGADGMQDTFELFARDFFQMLGFSIIQHPDRGADGKKDLIVEESRKGVTGTTKVKWLVSCKHYAHSGKSVSDTDEPNILERLTQHQCDGFLGFYSTIPATSLSGILEGLKGGNISITHFDRERIESALLRSKEGIHVAQRYFPKSFDKYKIENPHPVSIYDNNLQLTCDCCGKNLLETRTGIFVLWQEFDEDQSIMDESPSDVKIFKDAYFSCKGQCDIMLKEQFRKLYPNTLDSWIDISDYMYPTGFIMRIMAWFNSLNEEGSVLELDAFDKFKRLVLATYPYVIRDLTTKEKEQVRHYLEFGVNDFL